MHPSGKDEFRLSSNPPEPSKDMEKILAVKSAQAKKPQNRVAIETAHTTSTPPGCPSTKRPIDPAGHRWTCHRHNRL